MSIFVSCRTTRDGNCLYNACSPALSRYENLATCLRCLTCIKLYQHGQCYADHPLFHTKHAEGAFDCVTSAFIMALSSYALDPLESIDPHHAVIAEAIVNANDK